MDEPKKAAPSENKDPFRLQTMIDGKSFEFSCHPSSSLSHVYSALKSMIEWCEDLAKKSEVTKSQEE